MVTRPPWMGPNDRGNEWMMFNGGQPQPGLGSVKLPPAIPHYGPAAPVAAPKPPAAAGAAPGDSPASPLPMAMARGGSQSSDRAWRRNFDLLKGMFPNWTDQEVVDYIGGLPGDLFNGMPDGPLNDGPLGGQLPAPPSPLPSPTPQTPPGAKPPPVGPIAPGANPQTMFGPSQVIDPVLKSFLGRFGVTPGGDEIPLGKTIFDMAGTSYDPAGATQKGIFG